MFTPTRHRKKRRNDMCWRGRGGGEGQEETGGQGEGMRGEIYIG